MSRRSSSPALSSAVLSEFNSKIEAATVSLTFSLTSNYQEKLALAI
jgi:hypothetical protein